MIPHGDRRDGAESGRIEDEIAISSPCNDYVMRVLVLGENLDYVPVRLLTTKPVEDIAESPLFAKLGLESRNFRRLDAATA